MTLFHPITGHPIFSGPDGQQGYGGPGINTSTWIMPDGRQAWYYPDAPIDPGNADALGVTQNVPGVAHWTWDDLHHLAMAHGLTELQAQFAASIAMAESGGDPTAHAGPNAVEDSLGLWQINLYAHHDYDNVNLWNPDDNADAMVAISGHGSSWQAWSTFTSGAYAQYMPGGASYIPPQAGPGAPPAPNQGAVESAVDGLINSTIGRLPFPLGNLAGPLKDFLHPFASLIDDGIRLVSAGISAARDFAQAVGQEVLHDAENLFNGAVQLARDLADAVRRFAEQVGQEVLHDAEGLYNAAVRLATDLANAVRDFATAVGQEVLHDAESLFNEAVHLAEAAAGAVRDFAVALGRDIVHTAEALYNAAVKVATDLADAVRHFAEQVGQAVLHDAEALYNEAVHLADEALSALRRDVIDPLAGDLEAAGRFLWGDVKAAVDLLDKVWDWLVWLSSHAFSDAEQLFADLADLTAKDILDNVAQVHADNWPAVRAHVTSGLAS